MRLLMASLCLALPLAFLIVPQAAAQDVITLYPPKTIIPIEILFSWPAAVGSLLISIPLSLWLRGKARKKAISRLRQGECFKATNPVLRKANIQSAALVLALGIASLPLPDVLREAVHGSVYARDKHYDNLATIPEAIAENVMGPFIGNMREYMFSPNRVKGDMNGEPFY